MSTDEIKSIKPTQLSMASEFDNPNHPLYLHHSDQPGLVLVSQILTEENYSTWNHSMTMALTVKNKYGFINGSIVRPNKNSSDELQQWIRCDNLVKTWILSSLSKEIAASVFYCEGAKEIWDELRERFSQVNSVQLFHIENEIHDCVQGALSVSSYFTKLKGLWDERDVLFPAAPCHCGTMKDEISYRETQKTIKFLMGLTESFQAIRGQILTMDPFPKVSKAYSLVLGHERQRDVSSGKNISQPEAAAFAVRDPNKKIIFKCRKCGKDGHSTENCRAHLKCTYCGWKGHTVDFCRKLKRTESDQSFRAPTANGVNQSRHGQQAMRGDLSNSMQFTQEQCQQILQMIGSNLPSMANHVGNSSIHEELSGPTLGEDDWDRN